MEAWIQDLNLRWNELEQRGDFAEATVIDYIIMPFMRNIGYNVETCFYHHEYRCCQDGRVDMYVEIKDLKDEGIYVEAKRGNLPIGSDQIKQISKYLYANNIKWGILTNGKEYYLVNKDILSEKNNDNGEALLDRVVLMCDLKGRQDKIKYLSKEYIFYNRKTLLMKDIAQFKAFKSYRNWEVYYSTLSGFFDYYCEVIEPELIISSPYSYTYLSDIREKHFKQYLLTLKPKKKNKEGISLNIVKSKCSHISAMFNEFEKRKYITINNFRNIRVNIVEQFINEGIVREKSVIDNYLTRENIEIILKRFSSSEEKDGTTKTIIFGMVAYYGLTKAEVIEFLLQPWNCINFDEKIINFGDCKRNLPLLLEDSFKRLKKVAGKRKQILCNKGERGQSISKDIVAATFDEIKKMKDVSGRKHFTPEYVRKMLIVNMFESEVSIEEICGYVGISLGSIEKILGKDYIAKIGLKRWNMKKERKRKHPFEVQFNKLYSI